MAQNFVGCDRGQLMLLPPSLMDWLEEDHLVWTVLGAVDQMTLDGFYGAYRANGQGRAAYDPQMMIGLLLYAYRLGIRSSRQIERACRGDVAFKVITALEVPDHSTIAEFRRRHQDRLGELFIDGLALCAEAGLICLGEVAIDGTEMLANASLDRNRRYESIVEEILDQAERADREEDERHGDRRGDEPPAHLRTRQQRREALAAARERLQADRAAAQAAGEQVVQSVELELVPERFVTRPEAAPLPNRQRRGPDPASTAAILASHRKPSRLQTSTLLMLRGSPQAADHQLRRRTAPRDANQARSGIEWRGCRSCH